MNHVMIDIESMSTHPGNALVLSIGAVRFDFGEQAPLIGNKWVAVLDPREQLALGREVSMDTIAWWQKQSHAARNAWLNGDTMKLVEAVSSLWKFIKETETQTVWANGIVFDLANVESLFRACGYASPWPYNAARDMRTVVRTCPRIDGRSPAMFDSVAHDPVDDCISQINYLWNHLPELA